jgi:hypothetical protein
MSLQFRKKKAKQTLEQLKSALNTQTLKYDNVGNRRNLQDISEEYLENVQRVKNYVTFQYMHLEKYGNEYFVQNPSINKDTFAWQTQEI